MKLSFLIPLLLVGSAFGQINATSLNTGRVLGASCGSSFATPAIAPNNGDLILAAIRNQKTTGNGADPIVTMTGNGLTWVSVLSITYGPTIGSGKRNRLTIMRAMGIAFTDAPVVDFGGQTQEFCGWQISDWSGVDQSGTDGSGAIVQTANSSGTGRSSPASVTLSAFANGTNGTYLAWAFGNPTITATAGTGMAILGQDTTNTSGGAEWASPNGNVLSPSVTYSGTSGSDGEIGIEIKAGAPGPTATISPASLAFGNQTVGVASTPKDFTLTNTGTATLNITSIAMTTGTDFSRSNGCGATLAVGANCLVSVTFTPTSTGALSDSVIFTTDDPNSPRSLPVTGTGTFSPTVGGVSFLNTVIGLNVAIGPGVATPPPPPSSSAPVLPQLWVNTRDYATVCASYDVTLQLGFGTNDYPATQAGLNSALAAWGADTDKCYHIVILAGSLMSGSTTINVPAKTGATKYAVVDSSTPLTVGQLVCSHGISDATGPEPGTRNPGCSSPYNDVASMWTLEQTTINNVILFPANSSYVVFTNGEIRPIVSLTQADVTALILVGRADSTQTTVAQVPHHVGFDRMYIHGYDPGDSGAGARGTEIHNGITLHCRYCFVTNSYFEKIHDTGTESHPFLSFNTPGPVAKIHNWIEGGSITDLQGGVQPTIPGVIPSDIEIRRNRYTRNPAWVALTGFACVSVGCAQQWAIKNSLEFKTGQRMLIDGNIIENSWVDAQTGPVRSFNIIAYGSYFWSTGTQSITDVTETNGIIRHGAEAFQMLSRGNPGVGDWTEGVARILEQNHLIYDIGTHSAWGSGKDQLTAAGSAGISFVASASRTGSVTTYTGSAWNDCPNCIWTNLTGIRQGDIINVIGCADSSFNTTSAPNVQNNYTQGPNAIAPTTGPTVTINQIGGNATTTGCKVYNGPGWPQYVTFNHITGAFGNNMRFMFAAVPGFARNYTYTNTVLAASYDAGGVVASGWYCNGKNEGTGSEANCFDVASMNISYNVWQGRTAASYTEYPGAVHPPTLIKFPANLVCPTATPDTNCIGWTGFLNGATYPPANFQTTFDYHNFALATNSAWAANQTFPASDTTSMGADISAIDAAQALNQYVCASACGTGPYPLH